ncbi:Arc family DNA-binding protein [bacterium]|nr:Arc family DNA-binding protein [bacterium]
MAALLIKNLPAELHESLRARALRNHRSMNKEVLTILERALGEAEPPVSPLGRVKTFRPSGRPIPAGFVERIIREARDSV